MRPSRSACWEIRNIPRRVRSVMLPAVVYAKAPESGWRPSRPDDHGDHTGQQRKAHPDTVALLCRPLGHHDRGEQGARVPPAVGDSPLTASFECMTRGMIRGS